MGSLGYERREDMAMQLARPFMGPLSMTMSWDALTRMPCSMHSNLLRGSGA